MSERKMIYLCLAYMSEECVGQFAKFLNSLLGDEEPTFP